MVLPNINLLSTTFIIIEFTVKFSNPKKPLKLKESNIYFLKKS